MKRAATLRGYLARANHISPFCLLCLPRQLYVLTCKDEPVHSSAELQCPPTRRASDGFIPPPLPSFCIVIIMSL
ncbi:hypothetical protein J6590_058090 [Homalodisca vitripennis]|nr:hypothetical protein J6590_058090 [Homalodisca vitripennis]